jgi:hypothetical protein
VEGCERWRANDREMKGREGARLCRSRILIFGGLDSYIATARYSIDGAAYT